MPSLSSNPSICTRSWLSVCSLSSFPPPSPAPRCLPTASISSIKRVYPSKTKFSDVAGEDEEKEELEDVVDFLKNPKKYVDLGAKAYHFQFSLKSYLQHYCCYKTSEHHHFHNKPESCSG